MRDPVFLHPHQHFGNGEQSSDWHRLGIGVGGREGGMGTKEKQEKCFWWWNCSEFWPWWWIYKPIYVIKLYKTKYTQINILIRTGKGKEIWIRSWNIKISIS